MLKHVSKRTIGIVYGVTFLLLLLSVILAVNLGAVDISPSAVFQIIAGKIAGKDLSEFSKSQINIVWTLRFPKVLVAACTGAGLALSGIMMQAMTKNPLADPYVLGISSGASTGAVLSVLVGTLPVVGKLPLAEGAFAGAMVTAVLVFVVGGNGMRVNTTKMVLVGMALSALFSALTNLIIFLTPDSHKVQSAMFWMTGSFAGTDWKDVPLAAITLAVCILIALPLHKEMDALLMGEDIAQNAGVNTGRMKWLLIIVSTLLTSVLVSMSGIIGFVGLVIPHMTRGLVGAAHRRLVSFSILFGAIFMIWADVFARTLFSPKELPVGVVTALCGAPVFLTMLRRSRYAFGR
ncbi:MAG: iron ABC transporter permease [Eubacteriales bacterium]|nr:iron ABC transporter permease [Eubacteriales bacterium]